MRWAVCNIVKLVSERAPLLDYIYQVILQRKPTQILSECWILLGLDHNGKTAHRVYLWFQQAKKLQCPGIALVITAKTYNFPGLQSNVIQDTRHSELFHKHYGQKFEDCFLVRPDGYIVATFKSATLFDVPLTEIFYALEKADENILSQQSSSRMTSNIQGSQ